MGSRLTLKKFLDLGHIALGIEPIRAEPDIDQMLAIRSLQRRVVLSVPSYLSIPWLVVDSECIATVPSMLVQALAEHFPIAWYRPPLPIPPMPVSLIWHERTHHDPKHQWLRRTVATLLRTLARTTACAAAQPVPR